MGFPWFRISFRTSRPAEDLPLSTRVTTMEGDLLQVRAQLDSMHTTLRKLQGKIYRGVSLGDTVDAATPPDQPDDEGMEQPVNLFEKADLYRKAAQLRGR